MISSEVDDYFNLLKNSLHSLAWCSKTLPFMDNYFDQLYKTYLPFSTSFLHVPNLLSSAVSFPKHLPSVQHPGGSKTNAWVYLFYYEHQHTFHDSRWP